MEKDLTSEDISEFEQRQSRRQRGLTHGKATSSVFALSDSKSLVVESDPAAIPKPMARPI
jgi:hypothetical protein